MTFCLTYDELLSSTSAGSVRVMSPGIATTSLPPSLIAADGGADGADDAVLGAVVGAVVGAGVVAVPWQAANRIAATATTAPVRIRDMRVSLLLRLCPADGSPPSRSSRSDLVPADPGMILRRRSPSIPPSDDRQRPVAPPGVRRPVGWRGRASRPRSEPRSRRPTPGPSRPSGRRPGGRRRCPGSPGRSSSQFSGLPSCSRSQHRVWKRQPDGGAAGDGTSPLRTSRFLRIRGSGSGTADRSATRVRVARIGVQLLDRRPARRACPGTSPRPGR